jgi:fatty acid desaturase
MKFFRHHEDRLPVFLITLLFGLDLFVYCTVESTMVLLIWMVLALQVKIYTAAWNHHHQHAHTFHQTFLNRLLEVVYTFHTGVTTNAWVLHHNLGHHVNYLDQEKDESGWMRKDGSTKTALEYTISLALTGYIRGYQVGKKYPKYQRSFVGMGLLNLAVLPLLFWYNWQGALIVFLIPMLTVYIGTCYATYAHHSDLHAEDPYHASHNVTHRLYNILTGNLGYHTAHHMKQALHWSKLPEYHRSIEDKIPPELISADFPGYMGPVVRKCEGMLSGYGKQSPERAPEQYQR